MLQLFYVIYIRGCKKYYTIYYSFGSMWWAYLLQYFKRECDTPERIVWRPERPNNSWSIIIAMINTYFWRVHWWWWSHRNIDLFHTVDTFAYSYAAFTYISGKVPLNSNPMISLEETFLLVDWIKLFKDITFFLFFFGMMYILYVLYIFSF